MLPRMSPALWGSSLIPLQHSPQWHRLGVVVVCHFYNP